VRRVTPALLALLLPFALHAASGGSVRVEIKDPKGAPVADAIAWLTPLDTPATLTPPTEPVSVVQDQMEFDPLVTVVLVGTRVTFPNRDKVQHHVYSQSTPKRFDIPLYRGETKDAVLFDKPGVVTLGCNIHDWMAAYIVVLATPHFAKSGADGIVPLATLPAGRYRLDVWHPRITKMESREVRIDPADMATQVIAVTLKPDRRIRRAPEAGSAGYK
jgi:plastocyanin